MSSASSFSSELTRSSSSFADFMEVESRLANESPPTDADVKTEGTSSFPFLSDGNNRTNAGVQRAARSLSPPSSHAGVLPNERIHRYIDQCVPPELIQHQRVTDGRLMAHICAELVELGGPESWAARLPTDIFKGSVQEPFAAQGVGDADVLPSCIAEGAMYSSEDAPVTWAEDMRIRAFTEVLPHNQVPWASLTRHLHQLVFRLNALIQRGNQHFPCYSLPFRLQAQVTPVLFAWATCWSLAVADLRCWKSVVQSFHAACGAHPPPRRGAAVASRDAASLASSPSSPVAEERIRAEVDVSRGNVQAHVRYTFTLPWKPLAALFLAVQEPSNARLLSWCSMVSAVRRELPAMCRRASPFFAAEAVDGLWGLVCSELQRSAHGVAALSLFVQLVPYRHLCEPQATRALSTGESACADRSGVVEGNGDGEEEAEATPCLTSRTRQILRFLLVETASWSPPPPPALMNSSAASSQRRQKRKKSEPWPLLMSWRTAVVTFVGFLAKAHPSAEGLDDYAEPLFTTWLNALALPIGSAAGLTGATAAAAVSRVVRNTGPGSGGNSTGGGSSGGGPHIAAEMRSSQIGWTATPFARLLNAFPDNTESSLWRQLERWIHATSVLVRPGLPCTPGSAAERVCECYGKLAREALRRVPKKRRDDGTALSGRQNSGQSGMSPTASSQTEGAVHATLSSLSARYWSARTIDRFVQLFLPLAVSAFQTRAKTSTDFLICLLYMSPAIVLPSLLTCVDAGLHSPTEVAEHRRVSARLLMHAIVTLFTEEAPYASEVVRSARDTVAEYFESSAMLWLSLVSASSPEISLSVLTLLGVAVSYIPTTMIVRSSYEAEVLGTEYAARVISLFTERGGDKKRAPVARQKHIEAFVAALHPSALTMLSRAVLTEARNRDNGSRMSALVRMVAAVAPADAWRCAELTWLPVLVDPTASDADVEWAGALLAACVSELGDRSLVRAHAAGIIKAVHMQLRFLTSRTRRAVAVDVTHALVASLMRPRCSAASSFRVSQGRRSVEGRTGAAPSDDGSPLPQSAHPTQRDAGMLTGVATAARVAVEWPSSEEDVRLAAGFFNDALRDAVEVLTHAKDIRVCSPATAAAALSGTSLSHRFVAVPGSVRDAAALSPSSKRGTGKEKKKEEGEEEEQGHHGPCVCESASAVNPHSVLEGTLEWLLWLLEIFEWMYVAPAPPATEAASGEGFSVAAARKGVCWADVNPRSAWRPVCLPDGCQPAYSRAALFDVVYTHLCLPLIEHHVLSPLRKVGAELRPVLQPLLPFSEPTLSSLHDGNDALARVWLGASVVDWNSVCGLLRWLVLSGIDCPQHFWLPHETFFRLWWRVSAGNPSCRSRKAMPLSGWASRAMQLHVEAAVAGYLPVSQDALTRAVSVLQCLSFSPHERIRNSCLRLLIHDGLLTSLCADSCHLFVQRQWAVSAAVLTRWRALQNAHDAAVAGAPSPSLSPPSRPAAGSSRAWAHALQESSSGTMLLFTTMTIQNNFVHIPWTGLRVLQTLVTFPEELRTVSTAKLLPLIRKMYDMAPPAATTTSRSPQFMEEVVQLAGALVAAHPARAVVLLTLANRLYWPTPGRWLSMPVLRQLTRLAISAHVEVRSRAMELLSAVAAHMATREVRVPVSLLSSVKDDGRVTVPSTFLLSPGCLDEVDDVKRQRHNAALREVQASVKRLTEVLPVLPHYIADKGQVFPVCFVDVPRSTALAAGLPILSVANFSDPKSSFVAAPRLTDALADALPEDAASFREQWGELLLSAGVRAAGAGDGAANVPSPSPPSSFSAVASAKEHDGASSSWALRVLTLPIERPLAGVAQEASPSSLVSVFASLPCHSSASVHRVTELLIWAEGQLRQWEEEHAVQRSEEQTDGSGDALEPEELAALSTEAVVEGGESAEVGGGPRSVEEDEIYRLFLSVLAVATAAVRLTTPPWLPSSDAASSTYASSGVQTPQGDGFAAVAALRTRALHLSVSVLVCLCSYAAVPHLAMRSMMVLGVSALRNTLSVEEAWTVISGVSEKLGSIPSDTSNATTTANNSTDGDHSHEGSEEGDTWSQRQLRLITVVLTFIHAAPLIVTAALLPRLIALVSERSRLFFMSPADQVRQCTSRLMARLITMGYMHSEALVEYGQCQSAARGLLFTLLQKANTQVFQGKLPFSVVCCGDEVRSRAGVVKGTTERPFLAEAMTDAPAPSLFTNVSTEDIALLTTTALTMQAIPMDVFLDLADDMLVLLCYSLDLSFTKVQHLHEAVEAALDCLVTSWVPKAGAHHLLQHLCAICDGAVPYGVSRRSKAACTRALRFVVFRNLHRIGKYAMMLQVGDAALASLAHRDAGVRGEGSQLFAILTKVASEAQARVMMQALGSECRLLSKKAAEKTPPSPSPHAQSAAAQLSDVSTSPSSLSSPAERTGTPTGSSGLGEPASSRRMAVVQALGAAVLSDPGTPAPYVPRLMEALAACAREGNTECGRFAKRVFEQWWHAHREGWEQEYRKCFTAEQVDAMTDLLFAPRYYA